MKLSAKMINEIAAAIEAAERYESFGIRTQDVPFELGEFDHRSLVWDDGEMTDEELDGVSATKIDAQDIERSLELHLGEGYDGERIAILASNYAHSGEDIGEIVMSEPVVIYVIK